MQRRDRQVAFKSGVEIGAIAVVFGGACAANPVHGFTPWAGLRDDAFCCVASA